jgi:deoxyribonuclease-1-like protein
MKNWKSILATCVLICLTVCGIASAQTKYVNSVPKDNRKDVYTYSQFNACNIGKKKIDAKVMMKNATKETEVIPEMAEILRNFDLIAIQEVSTDASGSQSIGKLQAELNNKGAGWDVILTTFIKGSKGEKFALLFRKDKFMKLAGSELITSMGISRGISHPMIKDLRTGKIINIYNFHLKPKTDGPLEELAQITGHWQSFDTNYSIYSGDFNLNGKKIDKVFYDVLGMKSLITGETSLGNVIDAKNGYYSQEFDNIMVGKGIEVVETAILDFVPLAQNLKEAKKISDHLPVMLKFKIR